jgi:hypothetical protein
VGGNPPSRTSLISKDTKGGVHLREECRGISREEDISNTSFKLTKGSFWVFRK